MRVQITPRQKEVLDLLVQGLDCRAVGDRLGISWGTVHSHMENLRGAFACSNMVAVAYMYGNGEHEIVVVSLRRHWWTGRR